jgi:DNA-binding response OmpR family regulator
MMRLTGNTHPLPASQAAPAAIAGLGAEPLGQFTLAPRVLIVDDNTDSADSLALLLSMTGHHVRTAYDGRGALRHAVDFKPAAVLLDIGLPDMNGYDVARCLRDTPGLENILVIAITGYGHDCDRICSAMAGIDHHLVKPVDPDALLALLNGAN